MNKNKKFELASILVVIVLILVIVGGAFYLNNNYSKIKMEPNVSKFLYSNPSEIIPKDKLITGEEVNLFMDRVDDKYICISTGEEITEVTLFTKRLKHCARGLNGCQGSISRIAEVCGDKYIILEPWLYGPQFYGIFELK